MSSYYADLLESIFNNQDEIDDIIESRAIMAQETAIIEAEKKWQEHDLTYVKKLFTKSKNTVPRWADDPKKPFIKRSMRDGYYQIDISDPYVVGQMAVLASKLTR